jgi:gamma-aminobutyric acid type B receptor
MSLCIAFTSSCLVIILVFSAAAGDESTIGLNKTVLLLATDEWNGKDAALRAAEDVQRNSDVYLSVSHQIGLGSSPLNQLVQRLKEGGLEDIVAVVYPGHTDDTTVILEILDTDILKIPLITFSFPPVPTTSLVFPYHIQMVPSESALPLAIQAVMDQFGWRRAALLTQDTSVFTALSNQLLSEWQNRGVDVIHELLLLDNSKLVDLNPDQLFGDDTRIFVLNMYPDFAKEVLCSARNLAHYSSYVWITHGWYEEGWWRNGTSECTGDQLEEYLDGALGVNHFPFPETDLLSRESGVLSDEADGLVYDGVWAVALALNNSKPNFSRDDFRQELYNLHFIGVSGPVSFVNGVRVAGPIRISQYRKEKEVGVAKRNVAIVNWTSKHQTPASPNFTYVSGEDESTVWPTGVPSDGTPIEIQHYPYLALMVLVYLFAVAGLVFTVVCLVFNIVFRNHKLVRLSSPTLNYFIILGATLMYLASLGFFYPEGSSSTYITSLCSLRTFGASFGYSFAYGTINAKMWRVYYICTRAKGRPTMQGVPLKDWHLMLIVLVLVLIDSIIAVTVLPLDNARSSVHIIPNKQAPGFTRNEDGIKEVSVVSRCTSPAEPYWLGVLFGYKIIFQAIGVFLAFKIRKVKIRGLNESREVSATLYITSAILATMIVTAFALGEYIDVEAFVFGIGLFTATSVFLALTFASKMWGLYKDPEGKDVMKGTVATTGSANGCQETGSGGTSSEMAGLQARIRELEQLVKQATHSNNYSTTSE